MNKNRKILFAAWSGHNKSYYAYQTWNAPLRKIFQNFVSFDPQEEIYKYGKDIMNKRFLETVKREQPDYIFLWLIYEEFYIDTLLKIKEICPKAKIINYCGDDDVLFDKYSIFFSMIIDYFFVTHKEYIPDYKNKAFLSCATNTDQFKPLNVEKKYDVTFIGTPKNDRKEFVKYLIDNGIKIKIFGAGWNEYPEFRSIYGGFLDPEEYTKVINQSKINLCFTKNYTGKTHVIQRFFEINACKAFELTEYSKRYTELFVDKKELTMFKTKGELLQKIKYYLKNEKEREKVAEAAYNRVLKDFSKDVEFEKLFKVIFKEENKEAKKVFPVSNKKNICLSKEDVFLQDKKIKDKLKNIDYVSFKTKDGRHLKYFENIHSLAMDMYKKPISCSDYCLYSDKLGDYQSIYSYLSFNSLNKEEFQKIFCLEQIMVSKKFFLENIGKFRNIFIGKKESIIDEKNTTFITLPLSRVSKNIDLDYQKIKKISHFIFENRIRNLAFDKRMVFDSYVYNLISEYLAGNKFMVKYLIERLKSKSKFFSF